MTTLHPLIGIPNRVPMSSTSCMQDRRCLVLGQCPLQIRTQKIRPHGPTLFPGGNCEVSRHWTSSSVHLDLLFIATQLFAMDLIRAAADGNTAGVNTLLNRGLPCDWQSWKGGRTALFAAADNGHREVAALLLAKGARVDKAVTANGIDRTPLNAAAGMGHLTTVELLLSKGADVNLARQPLGITPLMAAALGGHCEVADLLLAKGADIGKTNSSGVSTALGCLQRACFGRAAAAFQGR